MESGFKSTWIGLMIYDWNYGWYYLL